MNSVVFYGYPKCSTCRKAVKWLEEKGYTVSRYVNVVQAPPSEGELKELIAQSGLEAGKFFNTSGEVYRELRLKDKLPGMNEKEKIEQLASNGRLIKRPIVSDGRKATVGFRPEEMEKVWRQV
jgi:arsenate reductase